VVAGIYIGSRRPLEQGSGTITARHVSERLLFAVLPLVVFSAAVALLWRRLALSVVYLGSMPVFAVMGIVAVVVLPAVIYAVRSRGVAHARSGLIKAVLEVIGATAAAAFVILLLPLILGSLLDKPDLVRPRELIDAWTAGAAVPVPWPSLYVCLAVPAVLVVLFIASTIFVAISSSRLTEADREWWGTLGSSLLMAALAWFAISAIAMFGPVTLYFAQRLLASIGTISGVVAGLIGFSTRTSGGRSGDRAAVTLILAASAFAFLSLSVISYCTTRSQQSGRFQRYADEDWGAFAERVTRQKSDDVAWSARLPLPSLLRSYQHLDTIHRTSGAQLLAILLFGAAGLLLSALVGANSFSLHTLYRTRLARAYLGSPSSEVSVGESEDTEMYLLRPELLRRADLTDPAAFVRTLQVASRAVDTESNGPDAGRMRLARHVWAKLTPRTRERIQNRLTVATLNSLVRDLNGVLLDDRTLLETISAPGDARWAPVAGAVPFTALQRNRAVLDAFFRNVITPMPLPADMPMPSSADGDFSAPLLPRSRRRPPLLVVNMAASLVDAAGQRRVEPFMVSPYHAGCSALGYRDARLFGGRDGVLLGTAITVSGAAADPNKGYHASPAMAFLLTVLGARMGRWFGNPGPAGARTWRGGSAPATVAFKELTATDGAASPYIHVSDGGHFDNLGLFEMVARRCQYIVAVDASADPKVTFDDLGNAIRKIRAELGIPIDMEHMDMPVRAADGSLPKGRNTGLGRIRYAAVDGPGAPDGLLIYIKAGCYTDPSLPIEVFSYAAKSAEFPHESVADDYFTETQFDAYAALGRHAVHRTWANLASGAVNAFDNIGDFANHARRRTDDVRQRAPEEVIAEAIRELK